MTEIEAHDIVTLIVTAFPNTMVRLSPEQQKCTMQTYRTMLGDLPGDVAMAATVRLLATLRYLPTPAEIREAALTLTAGEQSTGGEQWGRVLQAIRSKGIYRTPGKDFVFSDPVTARCVTALGWEELCNSENAVADRARFSDLYDKLAVQERRRQLSEGLPAVKAIEAKRQAQLEERGPGTAGELVKRVLRLVDGGGS